MKWLLIPALFAALSLRAQTNKLPQMTIQEGLSTRFGIGEMTVSKRDAFRHLQKNQNSTGEAYALFSKANNQNTAAWLWIGTMTICGAMGVYSMATDKTTSSIIWYSAAGLSGTTSIILSFSAASNYRKSVATYNRFAGY